MDREYYIKLLTNNQKILNGQMAQYIGGQINGRQAIEAMFMSINSLHSILLGDMENGSICESD